MGLLCTGAWFHVASAGSRQAYRREAAIERTGEHGRRAIVVGGSGMLAGVAVALARDGWSVAVLARGRPRLATLERRHGAIRGVSVDYADAAALERAIAGVPPADLVVAWIHSTAPDAAGIVARLAARPVAFVHVLGSAARDPAANPAAAEIRALAGVDYREVVLGFVREGGVSRWLTDEEICGGVLQAIRSGRARSVVGVLEPWSERPGST